jgi:hypothetical protein
VCWSYGQRAERGVATRAERVHAGGARALRPLVKHRRRVRREPHRAPARGGRVRVHAERDVLVLVLPRLHGAVAAPDVHADVARAAELCARGLDQRGGGGAGPEDVAERADAV